MDTRIQELEKENRTLKELNHYRVGQGIKLFEARKRIEYLEEKLDHLTDDDAFSSQEKLDMLLAERDELKKENETLKAEILNLERWCLELKEKK